MIVERMEIGRIPHRMSLQEASWIYRLAWKFGSDENLRREVDKTNQELARQPVDPVYVRTFQKEKDKGPTLYASSDQKAPLEKYKDTFMMNKALIEVIYRLKEKVEEWQKMRTGPEKARVAQKLIISMVGQRDTLFYMGLTWKSIVEPSYLEPFLQVVHEGLSVSEPKLRDLVKAWVNAMTSTLPPFRARSCPRPQHISIESLQAMQMGRMSNRQLRY